MASHDYQITIAGTTAASLFVAARFMKYTSAERRGGNLIIPSAHGNLYVPDKYFGESEVLMEVFLPQDSTDAAAEALSDVALLVSDQGLIVVSQVDPHRGSIRARVECVTDPVPTQEDHVYLFGFALPSGFWEDVSASQEVGNPPTMTTGGDRPIGDATVTFSGVGFLEHTDSLGQVSRITIDAAAGAGTYIVELASPRTVKKASVDQDRYITVTQPWWMKFQPGVAQSFTSDVSVTIDWRDKWS